MEHVFKAAHRFVLFFASVFFFGKTYVLGINVLCMIRYQLSQMILSLKCVESVFQYKIIFFFIRQNEKIAFLKIKSKHFYLKQT